MSVSKHIRYQCFFWGLVALSLQHCATKHKIVEQQKEFYSSWQGGFLLKYKTFGFGSLPHTQQYDPFFTDISLKKRLEQEFLFHLPKHDLRFHNSLPDVVVFTYFFSDSLPIPVLPYLPDNEHTESLYISDSLKQQEYFLVTDFVQREGMIIVWRSATKISFEDEKTLQEKLKAIVEKIVENYPG